MFKHRLAMILGILFAASCHAEGMFTTSLGFDYSSGNYGSAVETSILSIPLAVKYETGAFTMKASIPWLHVRSPAGSIIGPDGHPIGGVSAPRVSENGMGDMVTSLTWAAFEDAQSRTALDVTGKVKWGTADEDKGLGTGEHDASFQLDAYKTISTTSLFVTLGYKIYGDPAGLDFRNAGFGGVGFSHRISQPVSAGLSWDYRPKITSTGNPINELTAFMSYKFTPVTKLQVYALSGLSDGSPDWGGGVTLAHTY